MSEQTAVVLSVAVLSLAFGSFLLGYVIGSATLYRGTPKRGRHAKTKGRHAKGRGRHAK